MLSDLIQFISNNPNLITIICLTVMIVAFLLECKSRERKLFKDYKPIVISIGILGTFIGIFCGLWNFDTKDITASVPALLEGLKLAFGTSILGMGISIVMSIIENTQKELSDNDSNDSLKMSILRDILTAQKDTNKQANLIHSSIKSSEENINKHFNMVNESLKNTLDTLSKGATEEIIIALEKVISDFNKNLTEQFGDNFKQLNESVKKMIIWQENYKLAIEQIEKNLQVAVTNIEKTSGHIQTITNNYEKMSKVSEDLHHVIEANQNQIKDIETHMHSLKKIGNEAGLITASLDDFSKSIQGSLSKQSEGLNQRSNELNKELGKSLGQLDKTLATLTYKFKQDYETFFKCMGELVEEHEKLVEDHKKLAEDHKKLTEDHNE